MRDTNPRVWRVRGATMIAMLIALAQIGPALACAVFDGPGRLGCPALFHNAPANVGSPAGQMGSDPDGMGDDCSSGPSYLLPDFDPPKVPTLLDNHGAWVFDSRIDVHVVSLRPTRISVGDSLSRTAGPQGRHVYLATRRLRI